MEQPGLLDDFDHHDPRFAADPAGTLAEMRERCPVLRSERYGGFWTLSRYADVAAAARDDENFMSREGVVLPGRTGNIPIEVDPPDYMKYRRVLAPLFTPEAAARTEPLVRSIANELVDSFATAGHCDLREDYALPLPVILTFRLLGFPHEQWRELSEFDTVGMVQHEDGTSSYVRHAKVHDLIPEYIARRRAQPGDDMISKLVQARVDGRPLTGDELFLMTRILINGGLSTTTDAIGNALLLMSRRPGVRERLLAEPGLMVSAVEEFLRYEAPVMSHARTVARECEFAGQTLRRGEKVLLTWYSANRDEGQFPQADTYVIDRYPNRHLAFGVGIHRCLGSHLARMELRTALDVILARIPDFRIHEGGVKQRTDMGVSVGRLSLPAEFTPENQLTGV
jgi:cytochrome P450